METAAPPGDPPASGFLICLFEGIFQCEFRFHVDFLTNLRLTPFPGLSDGAEGHFNIWFPESFPHQTLSFSPRGRTGNSELRQRLF